VEKRKGDLPLSGKKIQRLSQEPKELEVSEEETSKDSAKTFQKKFAGHGRRTFTVTKSRKGGALSEKTKRAKGAKSSLRNRGSEAPQWGTRTGKGRRCKGAVQAQKPRRTTVFTARNVTL